MHACSICICMCDIRICVYEIHVSDICVVLCASWVGVIYACVCTCICSYSPPCMCLWGTEDTYVCVFHYLLYVVWDRGLTGPGAHILKRLSGWRAPRSTFGVTDVRTTPSFSVGPGDLNLGVSCSYSKPFTYWSISTQSIICFEIRSHCSSEWPGTHCAARSGLKLMTILLSQPSGMASVSDTQLW